MRRFGLAVIPMLVLLANPALGVRRTSGYVVRVGDTGSGICAKYHIGFGQFSRLNPGVNINGLQAGQRVRVSATADATAADAPQKAVSAKPVSQPEVSVEPEAAKPDVVAKPADEAKSAVEPTKSLSSDSKEPAKPRVKPKAKAKTGGYLSSYYDKPEARTKKGEPSVMVSVIRVVGALLFVVALAVLSLYALKNLTSNKGRRKSPKRSINVIETSGLGPNRALHVVQVGNKFFLVGSTPSQINLVAELNAAEAAETDLHKADDFASMLQQSSTSQDRADSAVKLSDALRDGANFLQKKTSTARSMRGKAEQDEI